MDTTVPSGCSATNVPRMATARWVLAPLLGTWLTAWLQNETIDGYWVQFDPDAPFRRVNGIKEIVVNKVST